MASRTECALAFVAALAAGVAPPAAAAPPDTITLGMVLEPPNLDPTSGAAAAVDEIVYANVFEGLTRMAADGSVIPGLAESWESSEGGRVYDFHLRHGVTFHDGAGFTAEELGKLDFLLVTYPLANPTAEVADVVLPGAAFAEKRGSMINVTGRLQRLNKANDGPGQTRGVWEIVRDLIQSVGGGNGIYSVDEVFKQLAAEVKEFEGLTLASIGDQGLPILETGETIPLLERERERIAKGIVVG